jgi:hypothetical protein
MKLNNLLYFLIIILVGLNIILNLKYNGNKKELHTSINKLNEKQQTINNLENFIINSLYNLKIAKQNRERISLNYPELLKQLEDGDKIICFMQKEICFSCIFKLLQDLTIMEKNMGNGHVLFVTNIGSKDMPYKLEDFNFPCVFVDTFYFPVELSNEPIIFVLNKHLKIDLFYLPERFPQFRDKYFNEILPNYFK